MRERKERVERDTFFFLKKENEKKKEKTEGKKLFLSYPPSSVKTSTPSDQQSASAPYRGPPLPAASTSGAT